MTTNDQGAFRIVIAIDVFDVTTAEQAYAEVYRKMGRIDTGSFCWESTDEWYDRDGNAIDEREINAARLKVLEDK